MSKAVELYRQLVDELAERSANYPPAEWTRNGEVFGTVEQKTKRQAVLSKLTAEEREVLAEYLTETYTDGVYDTITNLEWYFSVKGVKMTVDGEELPIKNMGDDFIGRRDGDEWY